MIFILVENDSSDFIDEGIWEISKTEEGQKDWDTITSLRTKSTGML